MTAESGRSSHALEGAYGGLNATFWMLCCLAYSFMGVFLLGRGYSNSTLGVIIASGHILGLLIQRPLAALADQGGKAPLAVIAGVTAAVTAAAAGLLLLPGRGTAVTALSALFLALVISLQPLVNGLTFYLEGLGAAVPFGVCRAVGSIGYGGLAAVLGRLILRTGGDMIPAVAILTGAAILLLMAWFSRAGTPPEREQGAETSGGFRAQGAFLAMLAATALLFFAHATLSSFTIQIVENVGGNSGDMGLLTGFIAVLELPAMLCFERLYKRFSAAGMLRFAAVFFFAKPLICCLARSVAGLYAGMSFQALSYALFIPASVRYAGEISGPAYANRAQAWVTAMITAGNIAASLAGGFLIDHAGVSAALAAAAVSAALGAALMTLGLRRKKG